MRTTWKLASFLLLLAVPAWGGSLGVGFTAWSTDDANDDEGLGLKLDLDLARGFDLEVRAAWLDELDVVSQGRRFELEATPIDVGLGYAFGGGERISPYVGLGVSYVFLNASSSQPGGLRMDNEAGYYGVLGIEGNVGERVGLFGEVLYRDVNGDIRGDGLTRDFSDFGVDLAGVGGSVGMSLVW